MDDLTAIEGINFEAVNCNGGRGWSGGSKVLNYLKGVEYEGITGQVHFDLNGFRTNFQVWTTLFFLLTTYFEQKSSLIGLPGRRFAHTGLLMGVNFW